MALLLITDLLNYVKLEKYSLPKYCRSPQLEEDTTIKKEEATKDSKRPTEASKKNQDTGTPIITRVGVRCEP